MKVIHNLRIEITPAYYPEGGDELRIRINVNDKFVGYTQTILKDDMTSRFDDIFTAAREAIRHAIKEAA